MQKGILYIVSTPIGNLEDISLRAIRTLKEADLVAAEDTRRTKILFSSCDIQNQLTSFHSYNIREKTPKLIKMLEDGKSIALVSDSGTPGISDPGSVLISECIKKDVTVTAIPGPTALITALVLSGKPTHKFIFEGFLSNKSAKRRKQLEALKDSEKTVIIYESPHRIVRFLEDFIDVVGDRDIAIARELTKKFEEISRETASELLKKYLKTKPRGEFIVIF